MIINLLLIWDMKMLMEKGIEEVLKKRMNI